MAEDGKIGEAPTVAPGIDTAKGAPSGVAATITSDEPNPIGLVATVAQRISGIEATVASGGPATNPGHAPDQLPEVTRAHYDIADELSRGGMGRILIARDRRIGRTVALKELLGSGDALLRRFEREALVTGRLQHPAIVPVYEAGRWPTGEPFFAMKLVKGRSLDKVIAEKTSLDQRLALLPTLIQICEAMAYAHDERVIHRDLKPANVLVGSFGETVVIDWGLAKDLTDTATEAMPVGPYRGASTSGDLTVVGSVMGTPMYMPPEQAEGKALDERADVYSLGAILYHVLAGTAPYGGKSADEILDKVIALPPPPISQVEGVPGELATIVDKAMARLPADRYPTAKELAQELVRFQAGQLVGSHRYSRWDLVKRFARRHRAALGALAALLVLGSVIATISVKQVMRARDDATAALAKATAERRAALVEEGRQELVAGEAMRAATYLAAAYTTGEPDEVLRIVLAEAMKPVDQLRARIDARSVERLIPLGTDRFLTQDVTGSVELWDLDGTSLGAIRQLLDGLVVSGDGTRLAYARADGAVVVDTRTLREISTLRDSAGMTRLAITTDGSHLYAVKDGVIHQWSANGSPVGSLTLPGEPEIKSIHTLVDGRVIVGTSAGALEVPKGLAGPGKEIVRGAGVAVTTDSGGRHAFYTKVAPGQDEAGTAVVHLIGDDGQVRFDVGDHDLAIDANHTRILQLPTEYQDAVLYDTKGEQLGTFSARIAALSGDGKRIAIADDRHIVRLLDDRGKFLVAWPGHRVAVTSIVFTQDGKHVVSAGGDGVRVWRVPESGQRELVATGLADGARSADGRQIVVLHKTDAVIYDVASGTATATLAGRDLLWSAVFSPDGTRVITTSATGMLAIWDVAAKRTLATIELYAWSVRFSPDGTRLITAGDVDGHIRDATTGVERATLPGADLVMSARFSADGTRAVTAGKDGVARVYDATTGALVLALRGHAAYLVDAAFDPTSTRIVTASGDATARLWDARTGALLAKLDSHAGALRSAAFSPAGDRILTVAADGGRVWNARTGALVLVLVDAEDDVRGGAFVAGGSAIATFTTRYIKLWEANRGVPLFRSPAPALPNRTQTIRVKAPENPGMIEDPRQRRAELIEVGDHLVLVRPSDGGLIVELPRERRSPTALSGRLDSHNGWKLADGGLVPSRDAPDRTARRSNKVTTYDFVGDTISGELFRPDYDPPPVLPAGMFPGLGPFPTNEADVPAWIKRRQEFLPALADAADQPNATEDALLRAALAYETSRKPVEAQRYHRKLATAFPTVERRVHAARLEFHAPNTNRDARLATLRAALASLPDTPVVSADALYELAWLRYQLNDRAGAYRTLLAATKTIRQPARQIVRRELFRFAALAGISFDDTLAAVVGSPIVEGVDRPKLLEELQTTYLATGDVELELRALTELAPVAAPPMLAKTRMRQAILALGVGDTREFGRRAVEALDLVFRPGVDLATRSDVVEALVQLARTAQATWATTKDEAYARAGLRIAKMYLSRWPANEPPPTDLQDVRDIVRRTENEIANGPQGGGRFDKAMVRRVVKRRSAQLSRCYEDGLARRPDLKGTIVVAMTIIGNTITVTESPAKPFPDPGVASCVVRELGRIALPRIPGEQTIQLTYPITLQPPDEP